MECKSIFQNSASGFSTIFALVFLLTVAIGSLALNSQLSKTAKMDRQLASHEDLKDLKSLFGLATETIESCATSGLIGLDMSPLLQATPIPVPVTLHLPGLPNLNIFQAGAVFGNTRQVKSVEIVSLTPQAFGNHNYIASIRVTTVGVGKADSLLDESPEFSVGIGTEDNNLISSCASATIKTGALLPDMAVGGFIHRCPYKYDPQTYDPDAIPQPLPFDQQPPRPGAPLNQITGTQDCPPGYKPHVAVSFISFYCSRMFYSNCSWHRDAPHTDYAQARNQNCTDQVCQDTYVTADPIEVVNNAVHITNKQGRWRGCGVIIYVCTGPE